MSVRISLECVRRWYFVLKGVGGAFPCLLSGVLSCLSFVCLVCHLSVLSVVCVPRVSAEKNSKYLLTYKRFRGGVF